MKATWKDIYTSLRECRVNIFVSAVLATVWCGLDIKVVNDSDKGSKDGTD